MRGRRERGGKEVEGEVMEVEEEEDEREP